MPRQVAPPPSGEFEVRLTKPFNGTPTSVVEVIGEPNREAKIRRQEYNGGQKTSEKAGTVPKDDVPELMRLISQCRGFPAHNEQDVYGRDTMLEFNTLEIQWSNKEDDPAANQISEVGDETKQTFNEVADSVEALGRTFAKQDSAI